MRLLIGITVWLIYVRSPLLIFIYEHNIEHGLENGDILIYILIVALSAFEELW